MRIHITGAGGYLGGTICKKIANSSLEECDAIICCGWPIDLEFNQRFPLAGVNAFIDLIQNPEMRGGTKIIFVSSVTAQEPCTLYDLGKATAEAYLFQLADEMNFEAVVVRLPHLYGPGQPKKHKRGSFNKIIHKIRKGQTIEPLNKKMYSGFAFIDDVATMLIQATEWPAGIYSLKTNRISIHEAYRLAKQADYIKRLPTSIVEGLAEFD